MDLKFNHKLHKPAFGRNHKLHKEVFRRLEGLRIIGFFV